ncbi:MAG: Na(+)-translocating NADH-quinone reductase subunit A [Acidobacteria bacterium]|nr:Na(+)-translocating NADH-quinone reductase subunit A [Acidobacteriota bacterium]
MGLHSNSKGLDLPMAGAPEQVIEGASQPRHVAVLADDYIGMKPTMHVSVGDDVRRGQLLFEDKKTSGVRYTAPASGKVAAVNRGARRALQSVVIQLDQAELAGGGDSVEFSSFERQSPGALSRDQVTNLLLESGLWTALRARPFDRVANPQKPPHSIFVTAMDTNPLAPSVEKVLEGKQEDFERGLRTVGRLTEGPVFVCKSASSTLKVPSDGPIREETFKGPHPSGTVGFHIHTLDPVDRNKIVWHVGYQDVVAIGRLFATGRLDVERIVALAGPSVRRPRLLRTRLGVSTADLTARELVDGELRIISGSVLSGRTAGDAIFGYLGRYHNQVCVLREGREREFLGWLAPGASKYSTVNTFLSKLIPGKKFAFSTARNGSDRAIVPIGMYERVMPLDILPTFLLRSLAVGDMEKCEELGCLELSEEDLALCSFVCPGKIEYGPLLRNVLTSIEKEG